MPRRHSSAAVTLPLWDTLDAPVSTTRRAGVATSGRAGPDKGFFDSPSPQSLRKIEIITRYAGVHFGIIGRYAPKLAYLDLMAGPGRYRDGTLSTPLRVLAMAAGDPKVRDRLVAHFNDGEDAFVRALEANAAQIPGINTLRYAPVFHSLSVDQALARTFSRVRLIPTLSVVDPWGYAGLSLALIDALVKDWGCDTILFFNYNRVNMDLTNPCVRPHMDAIFGPVRAAALRQQVRHLAPYDREVLIVGELCEALSAGGTRYVVKYGFRDDAGTRTTHHLVFVTKDATAYSRMKEVMARASTGATDGIAGFEYNPRDLLPFTQTALQIALESRRPLEQLAADLARHFAGRTLRMEQVYREHHIGTPFIDRNYKRALLLLEEAGQITTAGQKKRGTMADSVVVTFPALAA